MFLFLEIPIEKPPAPSFRLRREEGAGGFMGLSVFRQYSPEAEEKITRDNVRRNHVRRGCDRCDKSRAHVRRGDGYR